MGFDFMNYIEFEFWFQRFSAGNFDIDYDRSQDPKYRIITDIPVHVFGKIYNNLGDDNQKEYWFKLRHACTSFVDSLRPPKFEKIEIECYGDSIYLKFDECRFSYSQKMENVSEIKVHHYYHHYKIVYSTYQKGNYRDLAVDDLMSVLTSPGGYKLEKLIIKKNIDHQFAQNLFDKFQSLGAVSDVDKVVWNPPRNIDPIPVNNILMSFRSIKEIFISSYVIHYCITQELIDKIGGIKALKKGMVQFICMVSNFEQDRRPVNIAIELIKMFTKWPHLEHYYVDVTTIDGRLKFEEVLKTLGAENDPENPDIFNYPNPMKFDKFFEIKTEGNDQVVTGFHIERKLNSA
ncbi:unnamed protein product [Caenorhabditis nigoni]